VRAYLVEEVPVAESVRRLESALAGRATPWQVRVFEGSGHALYEPDAEEPILRRDFLDLMAAWIDGRARETGVR
jgi:hypothetical protein